MAGDCPWRGRHASRLTAKTVPPPTRPIWKWFAPSNLRSSARAGSSIDEISQTPSKSYTRSACVRRVRPAERRRAVPSGAVGFADDSAVRATGEGVYAGEIRPGWDNLGIVNGGYLLGIVARGLGAAGLDGVRLLPNAATTVDLDVLVVPVIDGVASQPVVWLAGREIDRFGSSLAERSRHASPSTVHSRSSNSNDDGRNPIG